MNKIPEFIAGYIVNRPIVTPSGANAKVGYLRRVGDYLEVEIICDDITESNLHKDISDINLVNMLVTIILNLLISLNLPVEFVRSINCCGFHFDLELS